MCRSSNNNTTMNAGQDPDEVLYMLGSYLEHLNVRSPSEGPTVGRLRISYYKRIWRGYLELRSFHHSAKDGSHLF